MFLLNDSKHKANSSVVSIPLTLKKLWNILLTLRIAFLSRVFYTHIQARKSLNIYTSYLWENWVNKWNELCFRTFCYAFIDLDVKELKCRSIWNSSTRVSAHKKRAGESSLRSDILFSWQQSSCKFSKATFKQQNVKFQGLCLSWKQKNIIQILQNV